LENSSPRSAATLEESYHKSDHDELTRLDARNLIDALIASLTQNSGEKETE
jgi:hypothetical protein